MKNGKYTPKKRKSRARSVALLVSVVLLCVMATGMTMAFLVDNSDAVINEFTPSQVTSKVEEKSFNGIDKSEASIRNTGDTNAFIRADIVVTWMDAKGNVLVDTPKVDHDYSIDIDKDYWFKKDGFYYYKYEVKAGELTKPLIEFASAKNVNEEFFVSIEILSSAIQANGMKDGKHPVELAWGVTYNAGTPATIS